MSNSLNTRIDHALPAAIERLQAFLRFPSVGTDPAHNDDTRQAGMWLVEQLREIGFEVRLRETAGQPIVLGHYKPPGISGPTLLYYGHYDVQPADPLEEWNSPPFEPTIVDGPHGKRVVARGAVDDKGQVMTWVEAFRAYVAEHGSLPCPVTVLVEGEEESSSLNLRPFIEAHKAELEADFCVISDTGMLAPDRPAITAMLRGIVYVEVTLSGPSHDLHSGMYGGAVVNPINALSRLLAGLHDASGRVTLEGFYDDVADVPEAQRAQWDAIDFDEGAWLASAGLGVSTGEAGYSVLERIWARPTLDVNGVFGGYQGAGAKTVIPAKATAKLSCRLVPGQQPNKVFESLKRYFEANCPTGASLTLESHGRGGGIRIPLESPFISDAAAAAREVFGREPAMIGCGGSIPVAATVKELLGIDTLLLGFGLDDDRVHSPNEKFEVVCLERGIKTHAAFLERIAVRQSSA